MKTITKFNLIALLLNVVFYNSLIAQSGINDLIHKQNVTKFDLIPQFPANPQYEKKFQIIEDGHNFYNSKNPISDFENKNCIAQNHINEVQEDWIAYYASKLASIPHYTTSLILDKFGNVYVTSASTKLPYTSDYLTTKYDQSGKKIWTALYDGVGQGFDSPTAIIVDNSGNVYVTGYSEKAGWNIFNRKWDSYYLTIKYDSSGVEQWSAYYKGFVNSRHIALAMDVDHSGNVYVTGYNEQSNENSNIITVKYNSFGLEQWVANFNGTENSDDAPTALSVDRFGNIYVTGVSGSFPNGDYVLIKYDSSGALKWETYYKGIGNQFDKATAISIDSSTNVYITGYSLSEENYYDYATIKYDANGKELWVARYNGAENHYLAPNIALDDSANVYIAGPSYSTVIGWGDLDHYIEDYAIVKYNSSGEEQWATNYDGPANSSDYLSGLDVDNSGNVYVTGYSRGQQTKNDFATIKYNSKGVEQWTVRYNGLNNENDEAASLHVDRFGNVYVAGYSNGAGYTLVKYDSVGMQEWLSQSDKAPGLSKDKAVDLVVDSDGNIYVTGYGYGSGLHDDYATTQEFVWSGLWEVGWGSLHTIQG